MIKRRQANAQAGSWTTHPGPKRTFFSLRTTAGRRRWFLLVIFLLIVGASARGAQLWIDSLYHGERKPYLQRPSADAISIFWQTLEPEAGQIRYRALDRSSQDQTSDEQALNYPLAQRHRVRLSGLRPATEYEYSIWHRGQLRHGPFRFWTWPDPHTSNDIETVRLWVLGDPGYNSELAQQVRVSAHEWFLQHPRDTGGAFDFWLTTGDNAYRSGRNREFQAALFEPYADWLSRYVLFPAYGNHDARRWAFFDIFDFPAQAESGGVASNSEHFYSLDFGPLHVLMLDSQDSDLSAGSPMVQWLQRDLSANQSPWTMAVLHHPPYSRGSHDSDDGRGSDWRMLAVREQLLPELEALGVDVVLTGHSHAYERSHLIRGHYGMSDEFSDANLRDSGLSYDNVHHYQQAPDCEPECGSLYVVLGNAAELHAGSMDHPALGVALMRGGSLILEVSEDCFGGGMLAVEGTWADRFMVSKGKARCEGFSISESL